MDNQENNVQNGGYQQQPPTNGNPYNQQPNNGYNQYGQQPNNGYNPQYGQQPNNGYNPQYGQPQYGQPQYGQPGPGVTAQQVLQASPAEKEAAYTSASSIFMLILAIISTLSLFTNLIGNVLSFNLGGLLGMILEIIIVIGIWLTFVNAKKKNPSSTGLSMIRVPYIIQFVFAVIGFIGNLIIWFLTFNILSLLVGILTFVFSCICFSSVNKTLKLAIDINQNKTTAGKKAGSFAAIVMIISASLTLLSEIVGYVTLQAISAALASAGAPEFLTGLLSGGGTVTLVVAVVTFIVSISGAIVMLQFGKKLKEINGQ